MGRAATDESIRSTGPDNGNISVATNQAAETVRGEFIVFVDHDDLLDHDALAHLALFLDAHPETDLVYSDDDKIGSDGVHHSPQFKPDWSPELLLIVLLHCPSVGGIEQSLSCSGRASPRL